MEDTWLNHFYNINGQSMAIVTVISRIGNGKLQDVMPVIFILNKLNTFCYTQMEIKTFDGYSNIRGNCHFELDCK